MTELVRAAAMFEEAIRWLRETYDERPYFLERDVVYAVQLRLWQVIREQETGWAVFNDYPMIRGTHRARSADLAICSGSTVLVAAEFKYEPAHSRSDLLAHKFPVIDWAHSGASKSSASSVLKDIERIREFVDAGEAGLAYAVLVDEGRHFR